MDELGGWGWLLAVPLKFAFFIVLIVGLVCLRLFIRWMHKRLPDSCWKRALFATHGHVRASWASYPGKVLSDDLDSLRALGGRKAGE